VKCMAMKDMAERAADRLPEGVTTKEQLRERMLGVIDSLSSPAISDSHIIRLVAQVAEIPRSISMVMELLEGPDLYDFLAERKRTLGEALAVTLTRQVFLAIHYLQWKVGLVHRDVKLENFGFSRPPPREADGAWPPLKLFDFGLSWLLPQPVDEETSRALYNVPSAGTDLYWAPEVWANKCGPALDVWAAGIMIYLMLSLNYPYNLGQSRDNMLRVAVTCNPLEFPARPWDGISVAARELVEWTLQKDAEKRATTAEVLAHSWFTNPGGAPAVEQGCDTPLPAKACTSWRLPLFDSTTACSASS